MFNIKEKIQSLSKWFKIFLGVIAIIYFAVWCFSIHLSLVQKNMNIKPILPVMSKDSQEYANLAQSLRSGSGFIQNGKIETLRAPGYPIFVSIFSSLGGYFVATFVQIILVFLSALLIREIGIVFSSKRLGEIAGIIFLLNPVVLTLSVIILTDILFLFLFLLGFYLTISLPKDRFVQKIILVSFIYSCAIYVRPMGVFALPIFVAPFLFSELSLRDKVKSIIAMIFIVLLAISPWVLRNYKLTGVADFTSFKAINLGYYAAPMFLANRNHSDVVAERAIMEKEIGVSQNLWRDLRYSPAVSGLAEKIILEHPFSYMEYHIITSLTFLLSSSVEYAINTYKSAIGISVGSNKGAMYYLVSGKWNLFFQSITAVWWKILEKIIWVSVYIIALFGFWKERKKSLVWLFLFISFYLMILSGPVANIRYSIQALPFILFLFVSGIFAIQKKIYV